MEEFHPFIGLFFHKIGRWSIKRRQGWNGIGSLERHEDLDFFDSDARYVDPTTAILIVVSRGFFERVRLWVVWTYLDFLEWIWSMLCTCVAPPNLNNIAQHYLR